MDKKGQISGVQGFIMVIIGVAVILAVGLIVVGELQDSSATITGVESHANETKVINASFPECITQETMSVSEVWNGTDTTNNVVLITANYSVSANTLTFLYNVSEVGEDDIMRDANVLATYSCRPLGAAYNATGTNISKLATISTWIGIMITVALAFIVLGYFYKRE